MFGKLNPKIVAASVFGLLLVGSAFWLSPEREVATPDPRFEVVAGPAPERSFIAVSDEDGDGIADWKHTLPELPDESDTVSATSTHTATVAVDMLEQLMQSNMKFGAADPNIVAGYAESYVSTLAADTLYTEADIVTNPNTDTAAHRTYGNLVAEITFANAVTKQVDDEVTLLDRVVASKDSEAIGDLALIAASYEGITNDLLEAPVPVSLIEEHLDLINAANALAVDVHAFTSVETDPLYALVRIRRYREDALGLYQAISNLYLAIDAAGVTWTDSDSASKFIKVE